MVLMIVSGRSGSGKFVALRALEDMGFYCVITAGSVVTRSGADAGGQANLCRRQYRRA